MGEVHHCLVNWMVLGLRDSTNRLNTHRGPVSKYPTVGIPTEDLTLFLPAKPFTPVLTRSGGRLDLTTARRISILRVLNVWERGISWGTEMWGMADKSRSSRECFKKEKGIKGEGGFKKGRGPWL